METIADYMPIALKELRGSEQIPFSAFLYFQINKRLVEFKKKGDYIDEEKLADLRSKSVAYFYIKKNEKEDFCNYKAKPFATIFKNENLSIAEKADLIQGMSKESLKALTVANNKEEAEELMSNCNGITKSILTQVASKSFVNAYDNITKLMKEGSSLITHAANVSSLSVMFAMALKSIEPALIEDIAMGALIHDLGLSQTKEAALKCYIEGTPMTPELMEDFKQHPAVGKQMLDSRSGALSPNIIEIIMQHHENYDGTGFPRGLKGIQINYLAKVVRIANDFDIQYRRLVAAEKFDQLKLIFSNMAIDQKAEGRKRYDTKIFDALMSTMEETVPAAEAPAA